MKIKLLSLVLGIIILGGAIFLFAGEAPSNADVNRYVSPNTGVSFSYPATYFLEEKSVGNGERAHYSIILTEDTEENRAVREGGTPGREGPTAITIDAYQNNLDRYTADQWIQNTSESNFKLSPDGKLSATDINGVPATAYRWSGLYEGKTTVVAFPAYVFAFSVTYLTPDDQIVKDFDGVTLSTTFAK